ncbi:arginine/serine-rich protein PNISR-like [Saccostrea echinata]|uniref:arginine/serine-rich protein PNISR-like n=1 Tax=Saccostrea echinata TaxID=191078 RepID=UPI002A7F59D9|nr:arginine/serine-rich protein PNISR-like [Saccostrea echinata]XP_061191490.1 arginine/serine-rich protein PNISR-like [Saccostrea echinata]
MSRFDVEKFDSPPDPELICCICQCVLDGPVESPCRHVFCKICIETWLRHNRNCPTCRHRLKTRHLKPILPIVQNMLNRLSMFCDFRINGCQERVTLEMYDKHINECDFKMMNCKYEKCFESVLRKFLKKHEEEECEHREKLCTRVCGLMIPVRIYDGHDCIEELRKYSLEQYSLVDTLKKKVNELNTMTEKLNQQIEALRREHGRSPSYDYLMSSSESPAYSMSSLDDYSQYSDRFSDTEDRRHGMTFEEFDRQDRNFWRSMRDFGDSPRRRRRHYRRGEQRDSREDLSGEIDVVNTPPRSPSPFNDQDGSDVEVDVVNESDVDRNILQHQLYSPQTSHHSRHWNDDSSERSYHSRSYQSRHSFSRDNSRSSSRETRRRRHHSSRSSSSNRTLRNRSWSSHYSDRSRRSEFSTPGRSFRSSRSTSPNSILSGESSLYHFRRRHSSRRLNSSSRSRSRSYSRSHSRARSSPVSPDYFPSSPTSPDHFRSRSCSYSDRSESSHNSDRDGTDMESDNDSLVSRTSSRFSHQEDLDYRRQTGGDYNRREIQRSRRPSDQSEEMDSSDDAHRVTREWLPRRRNIGDQQQHQRGSHSRDQPEQRQRRSHSRDQPEQRRRRSHSRDQPEQRQRRSHSRDQPEQHQRGSHSRDQPEQHQRGSHSRDQPEQHQRGSHSRDQPEQHQREKHYGDQADQHHRRSRTRNQPEQHHRGSHSPERPHTRSQQICYGKETNSGEKSATKRSQSDSGIGEGSFSSTENVQPRLTSKRKRTETPNSTNVNDETDSKRRKTDQDKTFQTLMGSSSDTSSSHHTKCDTTTTEHQSQGQMSNSRCGTSTTEYHNQPRNQRSCPGCGTSATEHHPKGQRSNSRQCTVTSQRVFQVQDTRSEYSGLDTENYNSDTDYTWEPGTSPEDSVTTSPSVYDTGSDYEVLIPKSAGQLLSEYASDETDESWDPESST